MMRRRFCATVVAGGLALACAAARAQAPSGDEDLPAIRISGAGAELLRLAVPRAEGDGESARTATDTLSKDADVSGLFQVLDSGSFPQQLVSEGLGFSLALWS